MDNILILGTFDGVHKGHRSLFEKGKQLSKNGGRVVAVLFTRHPSEVLGKNVELLNTPAEKERLISECGIKYDYIELDSKTISLGPYEYIEFLVKKFSPKAIIVGRNHTFGRGAAGNAKDLIKYSEHFGYKVFIQPAVICGDELVSSTRIRNCIKNGELDEATQMLGGYFSFGGKVVSGRSVGRTMGFPTANIEYPKNKVMPANGVYCVIIHINGVKYAGVMNVGIKPTFGDNLDKTVECFILGGYDSELYGRFVSVDVVKRIRDEMRFDSVDDLRKQIMNDIAITISYFKIYCNNVKF